MPRDHVTLSGRPLPHSDEAEMALLGAILHSNRAYDKVADFLRPEHFAARLHGRVYAACAALINGGQVADPITLKPILIADEDLIAGGGFAYLMRLAGSVVTVVNAHDYGRQIHDDFLRRELIAHGEELIERAHEDPLPPAEIAHAIEAKIYASVTVIDATDRGPISSDQAADQAMAEIEAACQAHAEGRMLGITTGLADLDRAMNGLWRGDLVTVGGATGMGKTGLVTTIMIAAARVGVGVLDFTLEMPARQMFSRCLSQLSDVAYDRLRKGDLGQADWDRLSDARERLRGLPIRFLDRGATTITDIQAQSRRLSRSVPVGLVIVDHIQIVKQPAGTRTGLYEHITGITGGLKAVAMDLDVCVIQVSQLNRTSAARDDRRPQLSDLRESGSIEQDSDAVLFVHRQEKILRQQEPVDPRPGEEELKFRARQADWGAALAAARGTGDIIIAKNRHGPETMVRCAFTDHTVRWADLARQEEFI